MYIHNSIPQYVRTELNRRRNDIQYSQAPRNAWFRVTSNASVGGSGIKVLNGVVVNEGESGLDTSFFSQYDGRRGSGLRPRPGVESLDISANSSSVEISFSWKAWSDNQLSDLAPYFLTPGITVIVDYGWSNVNGRNVLDVSSQGQRQELFRNGPSDGVPYDVDPSRASGNLHPIIRKELSQDGLYGIAIGQIKDFNVSYNDNGGFDITTNVIGINEASLHMRVGDQISRSNEGEEIEPIKPTLYEYVNDGYLDQDLEDAFRGSNQGAGGNLLRFGDETFMTWGYFEQKVLNKCIGYVNRDNPDQEFDKFDSRRSFASWHPALQSKDGTKCIVAGIRAQVSGLDVLRFDQKPQIPGVNLSGIPGRDNDRQGYLYNMYISVEFLRQTLEENENIIECVQQLLSECSDACYKMWEFSIETEGNNYAIVDLNSSGFQDPNGRYTFRPFTRDNIVSSFDIDFDLPAGMWMSAMRGSRTREEGTERDGTPNDQGRIFKTLFGENPIVDTVGGFLRRRGEFEEPPDNAEDADGGSSERTARSPEEASLEGEFTEEEIERQQGYPDALKPIVATGRQIKEIRKILKNDNSPFASRGPSRNRPLPIDVSLELRGIAGLRAFQAFEVANLPGPFRGSIFTITNVKHSIDQNNWTTSIDGKFTGSTNDVP